MKQFFKFMFASMLGTIVTLFLAVVIGVVIIGSIIGSLAALSKVDDTYDVAENSVLHMKLDAPIVDRGTKRSMDFDIGPFSSEGKIGLNNILDNLEKAAEDDRIKGIYLNLSRIPSGLATLGEIRTGIRDFKKSDKFVLCYGHHMSQSAYYIASAADEVYLYPEGGLDFRGFSTELMFFKGFLEKFNLDMQIIRGKNNKYKSAVEPFMYEEMSDANREQTRKYVQGLWNNVLEGILETRGISIEKSNRVADSLLIRTPKDAEELGFIDGVKYKDEILADLREKLDVETNDDINYVSLKKYNKAEVNNKSLADKEEAEEDTTSSEEPEKALVAADKAKNKKGKKGGDEKVAVIYATGGIETGKGDATTIGSKTTSEAIRQARKDSSIKAIVLRVNSPGGSALASDIIWREIELAKDEKPVITSMGDVAASGGYYISCGTDHIFANKKTITGSIGVFGMLPNAKELFNKDLGITFDRVETNAHSSMGTISKPLSNKEYEVIQEGVEDVYDTFLSRVAEGRGMTKDQVDSIGQGRVWSGMDAMDIGLIDEFGGLERAIAYAGEQAGLDDPEVEGFPKREDPFKKILKELTGNMEVYAAEWILGEEDYQMYQKYKYLRGMSHLKGVQARLPYVIRIR